MRHATGEHQALSSIGVRSAGLANSAYEEGQLLGDQPRPPEAVRVLRFELPFPEGEPISLELKGSGAEPSWLWQFAEKLRRFAFLGEGWNSYKARPLQQAAVRRSMPIVSLLASHDVPAPHVIPTNAGGIQFEWSTAELEMEISVPPSGPISFLISDKLTGEEHEWEGPYNWDLLQRVTGRLSQLPTSD